MSRTGADGSTRTPDEGGAPPGRAALQALQFPLLSPGEFLNPLAGPDAPSEPPSPALAPQADAPARSRPLPPAPVWYLWIDQCRPGFLNMAIDETLLRMAETTGAGFLRLYGWAPACLSFGRHEPALRRYDRDRIVSRHIDVVRRPTGGRAVWHNLDLTYAVAAPSDVFGPLAATHLAIHRTLAEAVEGLGVTASLAPARRPPPVDAGACFATAAGGEVTVANHKVVGSAQLRTRTAFLQHGSILLEGDQRLVSDVAMGPSAPGSAPTLRELVGRSVGFEEMAERVASAARSWTGAWNWIARGDSIVEQAAALADTYRSARWTWCR